MAMLLVKVFHKFIQMSLCTYLFERTANINASLDVMRDVDGSDAIMNTVHIGRVCLGLLS